MLLLVQYTPLVCPFSWQSTGHAMILSTWSQCEQQAVPGQQEQPILHQVKSCASFQPSSCIPHHLHLHDIHSAPLAGHNHQQESDQLTLGMRRSMLEPTLKLRMLPRLGSATKTTVSSSTPQKSLMASPAGSHPVVSGNFMRNCRIPDAASPASPHMHLKCMQGVQ